MDKEPFFWTGTVLELFYLPVVGEGIVQEASFLLFSREGTVQVVFYLTVFGEEKTQEASFPYSLYKLPDRLNLAVKEQKNLSSCCFVCVSGGVMGVDMGVERFLFFVCESKEGVVEKPAIQNSIG